MADSWVYSDNPLLPFKARTNLPGVTPTILDRLTGTNTEIQPSLEPIKNAFMGAGQDVAQAEYGTPMQQSSAVPRVALDVAGAGIGGSSLLGDAGSMGMFAGKNALTWDAATARHAERLEDQGASREQIWKDTGLYRSLLDQQWRTEIDDGGSRLNRGSLYPSMRKQNSFEVAPGQKLSDILDHPELYNAYPGLANMRVGELSGTDGTKGTYYPSGKLSAGSIALAPGTAGGLHSTLLHEVQHAIQDREGFSFGATPESTLSIEAEQMKHDAVNTLGYFQDKYKNLHGMLYDAGLARDKQALGVPLSAGENMAISHMQKQGDLQDFYSALDLGHNTNQFNNLAFDAYQRMGGEAEARNVQTRWDTFDNESPPWETMDVGEHELVPHTIQLKPVTYDPFAPQLDPVDETPNFGDK